MKKQSENTAQAAGLCPQMGRQFKESEWGLLHQTLRNDGACL